MAPIRFPRSRQMSQQEADQFPVIVEGTELPEGEGIYAFESEEEFDDWVKGTQYGEQVARAKQQASEARRNRGADHTEEIERYRAENEKVKREIRNLASRTGRSSRSAEVRSEYCRAYLDATGRDPAWLYSFRNTYGSSRWVMAAIPDLGWLDFNNSAASMFKYGGAILFTGLWWGGNSRLFFPGRLTGDTYPNLAWYGLYRNVSSVLII